MRSGRIHSHIRANVIGYVALFIALSGTAWAGAKINAGDISKNAVRSKQIKNAQVKTKDIRDGHVRAADVLDGSLTGAEIALGAIGTEQLASRAVTTDRIAAGAISSSRIAPNAVLGSHVIDNAVGSSEIADAAVGNSEIATDAVGTSEVVSRAIGADELAPYMRAENSVSVPPGGGVAEIAVGCPSGSRLVTGGAYFAFPSGDLSASTVDPDLLQGWRAVGQNNGTVAQDLTVEVRCLRT